MDMLLEHFLRESFVFLPNAIGPALLQDLRKAVEPLCAMHNSTTRARSSFRYPSLLEPTVFQPAFLEFANLHSTNRAAERILGTSELVSSVFPLFMGSDVHAWIRWHRDTVFLPEGPVELEAMQKRPVAIQYHGALYDDRSLWFVPGSGQRATLASEQAFVDRQSGLPLGGAFDEALKVDPHALDGMPGGINVPLEAGDCILYNPLAWHAAEYRPEWKRATIASGWRTVEAVDQYQYLRWGLDRQPWLSEPEYLGDPGPYFGPQMKRYLELRGKYSNQSKDTVTNSPQRASV